MNQLYTRRNIFISLTISLAVVSFFVWYTFRNMKKAGYESRIVQTRLQSLKAMDDLLDDMQDIETGNRGYIISGDEDFLEPYYSALRDLNQDTVLLKTLYPLFPQRKNTIEGLLKLVKRKAEFSMSSVDIVNNYKLDSAFIMVQSGRGRQIMDSIRQMVLLLENEDRNVLQYSNSQREVAAATTAKFFGALAAILISILVILFFRIRRDLKRRDTNEKKISYLADIVEQAGDAIISTDTGFNVVSWNKGAEEMYGYTKQEAIGKKSFLLLSSRKSDNERQEIIEILKRVGYYARELEYTKKNGQSIFVQASFTLIKDKSNNMTGCSIVHKDITEKRKAEKLLLEFNEKLNSQVQEKTVEIKELLERFKIVAKATNDVVWDADLKNGSVWWNDNFIEKFGYKINDETTSPDFWDNHVHPEDKGRVIGHIDYILSQTKANVWSCEYRFMKADGSYVNIYDRSYVMRDENGNAYRMIGSMADVTDLFRVREELNQSEEKYRILIEQATDGIFAADQEGKFVLVNSSACKLSQYSRDELLSMSIYNILDKDNIKQQPLRFEELREGKSIISERVFRKKDGETLQVEVNARQLSDGRMLAFIRDITEKKKAEEEVVKSNARFHIISKATSDIVWDWNLQDDSLWWNDNYYSNLGYKKQKEIVHIENWFNNIHPDDVTKVKEKTRKAFSGNDSVWRDEYRYAKPDGTYMNFLDRGYIMRDKDGKAYRMIGSMADITDIFLIREELKQSEERYRSLIEQASDAILVYSYDGKIHSFNISASSQLGYTREEFSKLDLKDILVGEVIADQARYNAILAGNTVTIDKQFRRKDGSIIEAEVSAKYLSDDKVLAIARNITERKKAAEELQESERFLNRSQSISKIGSYVLDLNAGMWKSSRELDNVFGITSNQSKTIGEWLSIVHPDHQKMMQEYFEKEVIGKKERFDKEYKIINKISGKECWVHGIGDLEFDANGSLIKMLGTIQDVTERKEAEVNQQRQFDELQQLYNLSVLIDRETDIEKIYKHAIDSLLNGVKADRCSILLFDRDGIMRFKASKGLSVNYIKAAEGHSPWKANTTKAAPIFIEDVAQAPGLEALKDVILNEGIKSLGFIPLVFQGKLIGKFMIYYNAVHVFTDNEAQFTKTVAHNIAFSVERNRSNEALQASENRYHSLVEQAADAIALFDSKGKILEVNNSALQLLGYKYGELMNMSLPDILTKEEIVNNPVQYDLLGKGLSTIKQRKMKRKDGSIVITEVNSKILPDGRFLSMVRDLTDRIEAQKQIEKEKELSDKIIDSLPGVFYFYDENGKFIRWNKQFEIVTGYTGKEISAMHPIQFFEGEGAKYIGQRIAKVFLEGISDAEAEFVSKDGSKKIYYFKAILVDYEGRPCLLGTGIDISDRKKAEKELNDSYKSIRKLTSHLQNVREEDRAHIAREIHDELGQQLTVLKMDVSWVNKKIETTDDVIKQKMKGLLTMLDETVKTVRRISSELRPSLLDDLGLTAAMEWQLHEFKNRSDIKISFTAPETEMKLPDTIKIGLFRIFQESLTNVVRHSNANNLKISLEHKDDNFILTIADDGKGFDKEKIADKRTLGILGMKERTSMIGGTYEITSTPGKGTVVVVTVPMNNQH